MSDEPKQYPHDAVGDLEMGLLAYHQFRSSRPWPDGSQPVAPHWNPGCICGDSHYYFEHDRHLAEVVLAAGYTPPPGGLPRRPLVADDEEVTDARAGDGQ